MFVMPITDQLSLESCSIYLVTSMFISFDLLAIDSPSSYLSSVRMDLNLGPISSHADLSSKKTVTKVYLNKYYALRSDWR